MRTIRAGKNGSRNGRGAQARKPSAKAPTAGALKEKQLERIGQIRATLAECCAELEPLAALKDLEVAMPADALRGNRLEEGIPDNWRQVFKEAARETEEFDAQIQARRDAEARPSAAGTTAAGAQPSSPSQDAAARLKELEREHNLKMWRSFNRMIDFGPSTCDWDDFQLAAFLCAVIAQNAHALCQVVASGTKDGVPTFEARQLADAIEMAERVTLHADWPASVADGGSIVLRPNWDHSESFKIRGLSASLAWALYANAHHISSDCLLQGSRDNGVALAQALAMSESWVDGDGAQTDISEEPCGPESWLQKQALKVKLRAQREAAGKLVEAA